RRSQRLRERLALAGAGQTLQRDPRRTLAVERGAERGRRDFLQLRARRPRGRDAAAPRKADARRGTERGERRLEARDTVGKRPQCERGWKRCGSVHREQPREVADRDGVGIPWHDRAGCMSAEREAAGPGKHGMQPRIAAKGEARTAPRELRREAQEEEDVADALFRIERERAPRERLGERLHVGRRRRGGESLRGEPPAVFAPAFGESPEREQ